MIRSQTAELRARPVLPVAVQDRPGSCGASGARLGWGRWHIGLCGGRQLGRDAVLQMHKAVCGGLWPDLTILMDCDVSSSVGRARRRNLAAAEETPNENRFEKESYAFFTRVRNAFLEIANREPQRVVLVDARPRLEVVHPEIVRVVFERLIDAEDKKATRA